MLKAARYLSRTLVENHSLLQNVSRVWLLGRGKHRASVPVVFAIRNNLALLVVAQIVRLENMGRACVTGLALPIMREGGRTTFDGKELLYEME